MLPNDPCQFVNFRVRATGIVPKAELGKAQPGDGNSRRALKGSRKAYFAETGGFVEVSVYDRILPAPGRPRIRTGDNGRTRLHHAMPARLRRAGG